MGIDVQLMWTGRDKNEEEQRFDKYYNDYAKANGVDPNSTEKKLTPMQMISAMDGLLVCCGHLGCLRESYTAPSRETNVYDIHTYSPDAQRQAIEPVRDLQRAMNTVPYALEYLFHEAWESKDPVCKVSSNELRKRLAGALDITRLRYKMINYNPKLLPRNLKSFRDFVDLFEELERQGKDPYVEVSY